VVTSFSDVRSVLGGSIRRALPGLNVHHYVPRSLVPPAAIVQPNPHNTIDYEQQYSSGLADWMFTVMIVVGQVDDESAQDQVGAMLTPNSPLICAINESRFETGWARVQRGNVAQMNFGKALYTYAELTVRVTT
jgi:hypothetical protein